MLTNTAFSRIAFELTIRQNVFSRSDATSFISVPAARFNPLDALARFNPLDAVVVCDDIKLLQRFQSAMAALPTAGYAEVKEFAELTPKILKMLAGDAPAVLLLVRDLFEVSLPGDSQESKVMRAFNPTFWRRHFWLVVRRFQEHLRLTAGAVGGLNGNAYASAEIVQFRQTQLKLSAEWAAKSEIVSSTGVRVPLSKILKTASQRIAKVYAFVSAIDRASVEAGLEVSLITTTLPGDWHANPGHKSKNWQYNGKTPAEGAKELTRLFQNVRRDLANDGIYLSGLWAGELHKDGTPHRHYWTCYKPEHRAAVLAAFLKYFPGRLKLRGATVGADIGFNTPADVFSGNSYYIGKSKRGFQVDVSVIDRSRGSGASYVFKYLEKAMVADALTADASFKAIDASRALWSMRSHDFFGVSKCLSKWDELRRLSKKPADPRMAEFWAVARGGTDEGRAPVMTADDGTVTPQCGDAYTFLQMMGGLAAMRAEKGAAFVPLAFDFVKGVNQYQEPTKSVVGLVLNARATVLVLAAPDSDGVLPTYARGARAGSLKYVSKTTVYPVSTIVTRFDSWSIQAMAPR